jgi:hypothetical protein
MEKQTFGRTVNDVPVTVQAYFRRVGLTDALISQMLLAVTLAAGAAIRLWQINALGLNSDEAVYSGQAAAMAQVPYLQDFFPVFRAHPLLYQFLLALIFRYSVSDLWPRLLGVVFGVGTIFVLYLLGSLLYGQKAGNIAALFIALMPYHVIATRQGLLDGPLVFFATLTLYLLAKYADTGRSRWLWVTGVGLGLTFLAKETGIILLGSIYAFLALSREVRIRFRDLIASAVLLAVMISPFAISLWLSGAGGTGQSYLIWQLFRQPNHSWDFYLTTVPQAIGYLVILVALIGLWLLRRERSWKERLLLWWIIVPIVFFELWPTKGFQYLLPIAPPFAVLAAGALVRWSPFEVSESAGERLIQSIISQWLPSLIAISLLIPSLQAIQPLASTSFLAGTGGIPGVRETGDWIDANTPKGAIVLTIGPSMANVIRFYGQRTTYALSVSPNPLYRNPSYVPVLNPDLQIRYGDIQYLVWDSFSANRSQVFSDTLLRLSRKFNGRVLHTEFVKVTMPDGTTVEKPAIIIFEVHR